MAILRRDPRPRARLAGWISTSLAAVVLAIPFPAAGVENRESIDPETALTQPAGTTAWKFTPTYYNTTNEPSAWDLNLRGNNGPHTWWTGFYRRQEEFQQLRFGYEYSMELPFGRLVPSLQYATRGFFGGSATAEVGDQYFGLLGWGRTNLKDYYNLNFDPNDAVTFGAGTRALDNTTLTLFRVQDDRLGTGQRVTHLVARIKPDDKTRWTVDVFHKQGRPDSDPASEKLHGTGVTVTYDFDRYFVRVATDPHVNFSNNNMVRTALGLRF